MGSGLSLQMISTAIILAAGRGTRLGNSLEDRPKGFLQIGDETLIERSLRLLHANGVDNVLIGTGYLAEMYEALASRYDFVSCVYSDAYAISDSMYTLYQMRDHISSDVLLLESDLLYEDRALTSLQQSTGDVILASDASRAGDEVFIQTDADGYLVDMSKDRSTLSSVAGELVGISRLTSDTLQDMFRFAGERFQDDLKLDYEQTLVAVAASRKLSTLVTQNLIWCEIDDACHLKRATQHIYPAICAGELADGKSITRNVR